MCDCPIPDQVEAQVTAALMRYSEQIGPLIENQVRNGIKVAMTDTRELLVLELTGESWEKRDRVKGAVQFSITLRKYFLIVIAALSTLSGKAIWDAIVTKGPG